MAKGKASKVYFNQRFRRLIMERKTLFIWALVGLFGVVIVMLAAMRVGGVSIRSAGNIRVMGKLRLDNELLSRGVPVNVKYDPGQIQSNSQVIVLGVRSASEEAVIKGIPPIALTTGMFAVVIPCAEEVVSSGDVRLVLMDEQKLVLAQSENLKLAPAGPECFYNNQ